MLFACREKFTLPVKSPPTGYLVVEGFINTGVGPTDITLSRSNTVSNQTIYYETGADVQVEGNDNSVFSLSESIPGVYHSDQLHLGNAQQYRLRIKTTSGGEYLSVFTEAKSTPPIDSISWQRKDQNDGVRIYVTTHDPTGNSHYYYWSFQETWEFHMAFVPKLKYDTIFFPPPQPSIAEVSEIPPDSSYYRCWSNDSSTAILISSSTKLSTDIISEFPIEFIPPSSIKLSVKYSILVSQHTITEDAYNFLQIMKKNTEQTGSVFDPQPSELKGNIHSTTNPNEIVVGYISASSLQQDRIFISNEQVPGWNYNSDCFLTAIVNDDRHVRQAIGAGWVPIKPKDYSTGAIDSFYAAIPLCADCRKTGSLARPSFWP
jgi:hypothetical protein